MIARASRSRRPPGRWASTRKRWRRGWRVRASSRGAAARAAVSLIPSSRASYGCWTATRIALSRSSSVWEGYRGGVTILRDYVRCIRPTKRPVYLKLHFAPGECAQVDWGAYGTVAVGNTRRRLSFFVMVLAFSRQMFVEFTVSQTMEHFLACHEHGFAAFGGVPSKIMVDNLKSAVLQRLAGAAPVFNPRYLDFARHHGFAI